jgi:hypothetical protein
MLDRLTLSGKKVLTESRCWWNSIPGFVTFAWFLTVLFTC